MMQPETACQTAVIVDIETTGLDFTKHEIIEIGILAFRHRQYKDVMITNCYGGLSEPKEPLSPEIRELTGLSDAGLRGQRIHWPIVQQLISESDLVIAHNAVFDHGFLTRRPELLSSWPRWGCSMKHIDWKKHGYRTKALNYLACDHGFINPFAHRAVFDCATTLKVIKPHLREIYTSSLYKEFQIYASGAPFEAKDLLKARGYKWDPENRTWYTSVLEPDLEPERRFLATEVYQGTSRHKEELIPALT